MELYIVKVKDLFLSKEWDSIGSFILSKNPQKDGLQFYEDEATAHYVANMMGGTVLPLSNFNAERSSKVDFNE